MNNFGWVEPKTISEASEAIKSGGAALSGGIELLCLLKENLIEPKNVVNLKSLSGMRSIETADGIKIGALVTIDEIAANKIVKQDYPVLAQAADSVASPQIRNIGTIGGNLCQRPRCWYFRDSEVNCLKKGGQACYAVAGNNEYHAILGGGPCYIVHPSDLAPALIALAATAVTNERRIPLEEFFVLPSENLLAENVLNPGEIVTGIEAPQASAGWKGAYYKARERTSFDWALSSCAVALKMSGGAVAEARVVLGGVAPIPWRSKEAEDVLTGSAVSVRTAEAAGKAAVQKAQPMADNAYKIKLSENVVKIAVMNAAGID